MYMRPRARTAQRDDPGIFPTAGQAARVMLAWCVAGLCCWAFLIWFGWFLWTLVGKL